MSTTRRSSGTAGVLLALVATFAVLGLTNQGLGVGEDKSPTTAVVSVAGYCQEVPASCLTLLPTTLAFPSHVAPTTETVLPILHRLEIPELEEPSGTDVLIPTPPPRSA
jgi:hypothetical protein